MMLTYRLLEIKSLPRSEAVACQWNGCNHGVYQRVHVVERSDGEVLVVGSSCYRVMKGLPGAVAGCTGSWGSNQAPDLDSIERARLMVEPIRAVQREIAGRLAESDKAFAPARGLAAMIKGYPASVFGPGFEEAENKARREFETQGLNPALPGWFGLFRVRVLALLGVGNGH